MIVQGTEFSCNGRITGYLISLERDSSSGDYPIVQVWRRNHTNQQLYNRVTTLCALTGSNINNMAGDYYLGNVSCTGNKTIEFQSGDVIGYYHANTVQYRLWSIKTTGYTVYQYDNNSSLDTLNISANNVNKLTSRQPLIQVMFGKINIVVVLRI